MRNWEFRNITGVTNCVIYSQVLDPKKYFVVTFALFSNGEVCDPRNVLLVALSVPCSPLLLQDIIIDVS